MAVKVDRYPISSASEMPVKFQSYQIILNTNLHASRLRVQTQHFQNGVLDLEPYGMHWKHDSLMIVKDFLWQMCVPLENSTYFGDGNGFNSNPIDFMIFYNVTSHEILKQSLTFSKWVPTDHLQWELWVKSSAKYWKKWFMTDGEEIPAKYWKTRQIWGIW